MSSRVGVVVFPGSNCEQDVVHALRLLGSTPELVWHGASGLDGLDAVVLPGGFAYGDYLRTGAIAAFSPIMDAVGEFARAGRPVIGICNGFQILCEAGLLPGVLRRNIGLKFLCKPVHIRVETANSPFTHTAAKGDVLRIPINHFEGNYFASEDVLDGIEAEDGVAFRYSDLSGRVDPSTNPNGAARSIAGVLSKNRNVLGMMPHPERATDPEVGGTDGRAILGSMLSALEAASL